MNDIEKYEFDRVGYIVIRNLLTPRKTASLSAAIDELEAHALAHLHDPPRKVAAWGPEYHHDVARGYYASGEKAEGKTLMIEDFWNADPRFDVLVNHPETMKYIRGIVQGRATINNSEIRIRYRGNATGTHGGTRTSDRKYRYEFTAKGIDCGMVRMIYFVHDVSNDQGAFCVVPASHKTNLSCPYGNNPDDEPGMVGLEVKAGDGILFTENLRHGGLTNRSDQVRKTLHVGYGPFWMMSQNIATMDEPQYITETTLARWDVGQRALFQAWPRTLE
ncbi:MAG: phytanoyl-CoA dioxygenase family protein [candidate division Zixibacteria bacterium]|nr:phytanoyl-CoA dioxygenase family protein [candidate division Zixibacteria bacterium]